jgi:hypothetical protein
VALPFSLHPSFIAEPLATAFELCVAVTASTFKKYLQMALICSPDPFTLFFRL